MIPFLNDLRFIGKRWLIWSWDSLFFGTWSGKNNVAEYLLPIEVRRITDNSNLRYLFQQCVEGLNNQFVIQLNRRNAQVGRYANGFVNLEWWNGTLSVLLRQVLIALAMPEERITRFENVGGDLEIVQPYLLREAAQPVLLTLYSENAYSNSYIDGWTPAGPYNPYLYLETEIENEIVRLEIDVDNEGYGDTYTRAKLAIVETVLKTYMPAGTSYKINFTFELEGDIDD